MNIRSLGKIKDIAQGREGETSPWPTRYRQKTRENKKKI
jgi:hypothetical protein